MSQHKDTIRLRHMLESTQEALNLIKGKTRTEIESDRVLSLALVRLMEVVGEAAARVSPAGQEGLPQVPWSQIVGLRNRLIHGYDAIDMDILWNILSSDLPPLIAELANAIPPDSD